MTQLDRVTGIERFAINRGGQLDTSVELDRCRHCGESAGYRDDPQDYRYMRVECSNTSCGIATPFHYSSRRTAAYAWNRRPGSPPKEL